MPTVGILGGGIAGLTAAFELQQRGLDVTVFEAAPRPGGMIRSEHVPGDADAPGSGTPGGGAPGGFTIEHGPNSLRRAAGALARAIDALGLQGAVVPAADAAQRRYVVRDGQPVALPASPLEALTTPLLSWPAKLRLLAEPFIRPLAAPNPSVAAFARHRLGSEVLDYAVDPFVGGIFAGDPRRLSLRHAFRPLYEMEQQHGSLARALLAKLTRRAPAAAAPAAGMPEGGVPGTAAPPETQGIFSFRGGLQTLTDAFAGALGSALCLATPALALHPPGDASDAAAGHGAPGRWRVTVQPPGADAPATHAFDAVVSTLPPHRLARLDLGSLPAATFGRADALAALFGVSYPPVSVLALGFRRADVAHPLDGFGMLVPRVEHAFGILGTIFVSSVFPERAPDGHVLLAALAGGARRPALGAAGQAELRAVVLRDLRRLLGVRGAPVFERHVRWPRAIPQYERGYDRVTRTLERLEAAHPTLAFAGNYRQGVSVGDTMDSAADAATRLTHALQVMS